MITCRIYHAFLYTISVRYCKNIPSMYNKHFVKIWTIWKCFVYLRNAMFSIQISPYLYKMLPICCTRYTLILIVHKSVTSQSSDFVNNMLSGKSIYSSGLSQPYSYANVIVIGVQFNQRTPERATKKHTGKDSLWTGNTGVSGERCFMYPQAWIHIAYITSQLTVLLVEIY